VPPLSRRANAIVRPWGDHAGSTSSTWPRGFVTDVHFFVVTDTILIVAE